MRAGKLRHRLTVEHRVAGSPQRTSTGAASNSWTTLDTLWGALEPLAGRRLEIAQATWPKVTAEARIRYSSAVWGARSGALRISYGGAYYPVEAVLNPELNNVELRLMCSTGAASG